MAAEVSDNEDDKSVQSYAALGVGLVVLVFGLPLWWKTTEVYRVALPYGDIEQLATTSVSYSVEYHVVSFADDATNAKIVSTIHNDLHSLLNQGETDSKLIVKYAGHVRQASQEEKNIVNEEKNLEVADFRLDGLTKRQNGNYTLYLLSSRSDLVSTEDIAVVGRRRAAYVRWNEDKEVKSLLPVLTHIVRDVFGNERAVLKAFQSSGVTVHNMRADKDSMRSFKLSLGYDITFTLFNPQPDMLSVGWDIESGIEDYLQPVLNAFKQFTHIKVTSQHLYYIGLGVLPTRDEAAQCSVLKIDQLPHIINPIEAYLGSHVSNQPSINFVLYVPTRDQSPLKIYDLSDEPSATNALFSPRWGGLLVYNVDTASLVNVSYPVKVELDMKRVMAVFTAQLRLLLGVHSSVSYDRVTVLPPGGKVITDWELDGWLREKSMENIATSASTLQSLAELLEKIENLVINNEIGKQVENAVRSLRNSTQFHEKGMLRSGFLTSREALKSSEKAFFDPSLLELLYFPEDQKFAIYIPLFLPIGIPIVMSVLQALSWFKKKNKTKSKVD